MTKVNVGAMMIADKSEAMNGFGTSTIESNHIDPLAGQRPADVTEEDDLNRRNQEAIQEAILQGSQDLHGNISISYYLIFITVWHYIPKSSYFFLFSFTEADTDVDMIIEEANIGLYIRIVGINVGNTYFIHVEMDLFYFFSF